MSFTAMTLGTWATLFAALGGVVTLMYLLKLRRRRVEVPFGPLWQKVLSERQSNSLFRVLKRFFSWFLQLLFIALVLLAIADPMLTGDAALAYQPPKETEPKHTLLLVDTSASMQATDRTGGRFTVAQQKAHEVVSSMVTGEVLMVASVGRDILTETDWTADSERLRSAVNGLRVADSATRTDRWLDYARNAVRGLADARVVLITDRGFAPIDEDLAKAIDLQVISVEGTEDDEAQVGNVAVVDFVVRSHLGNSLKYAVYYRLKNISDQTVTVKSFLHVDPRGDARNRADLLALPPVGKPETHTLAPGEEKSVERLSVDLNGARAALAIETEGVRDILAADDVAYSVIPARKRVRVAMVGPEQMFVEAALRARKHVDVFPMSLDEWTGKDTYDLVVFNGVAPRDVPQGNSIWLNVPEGGPAKVKGDAKGGELIVPSSRSKHPAMRYVRFVELEPETLLGMKARRGEVVLARTRKGNRAAIVAHSDSKSRWVAVGFDPIESEWVAHYSFSIFFVNSINWFFEEESRLMRTLTLARQWNVEVPWPDVRSVDVVLPSGETERALVDASGLLAYTGQHAGFYELHPTDDDTTPPHVVAASLANPTESTLAVAGDYAAFVPREAPRVTVDKAPRLLGASVWQLLVLLGGILVLGEWFSFNRRWTV